MKLGGKFDHEVVQHILFQGYSTPNFDLLHFKDFLDLTLFGKYLQFSSDLVETWWTFLDYEVMQRILFQGYSTQNFDRVFCSLKIVLVRFYFQLTLII